MFSTYRLERVPPDASLQAWNAADELFLGQKHELKNRKILLINDHFGALAVALQSAETYWWCNSAMSKEAMIKNCLKNRVPTPKTFNTIEYDITVDIVIIQIPKSVNLFSWQLEQAVKTMGKMGKVYALGMAKHISSGHIDIMNTLFTKVNPGRAIKKARVIEMEQPTDITKSKQILQVAPQLDASLVNLPGSFAEKTVDQGALVFIEHFNQLPNAQKVLDLGCGNGILSLAYLKTHAPTELFLVDENNQALKSAQINLAKAAPTSKVTYCHSNSLNELSTQTFELIICNPPFHQENTLTEKIAEKMFVDVANALEKDGQFWMVANRHLTYYTSLKKHFRDVHIKSKHAKFNVFCCRH